MTRCRAHKVLKVYSRYVLTERHFIKRYTEPRQYICVCIHQPVSKNEVRLCLKRPDIPKRITTFKGHHRNPDILPTFYRFTIFHSIFLILRTITFQNINSMVRRRNQNYFFLRSYHI